jgi:hypothetical protein
MANIAVFPLLLPTASFLAFSIAFFVNLQGEYGIYGVFFANTATIPE